MKKHNIIITNILQNNTKECPKNISLLSDLTKDSYTFADISNTFLAFKSVNDIFYLIYSNFSKSIICFDLVKQMIIAEIKSFINEDYITNFRHYLDEINKRDLIMTIYFKNNKIRLWNVYNFECILQIQNINNNGFLFSACFINEKNNNYF